MKWDHRLSRAYWLWIRAKRYPQYARRLGSDPPIFDQLDLAMDLLWPLARRVFLMHRVDELPYGVIAIAVDVDVATVERCVADALLSVRMVRREFERTS
jgi:DNA-directed RNA polymerase specialized sigma24 family protein